MKTAEEESGITEKICLASLETGIAGINLLNSLIIRSSGTV
jgi:hypothetical protein